MQKHIEMFPSAKTLLARSKLLDQFLTLDNAIKYNNEQNKLFFIADELDISPQGRKVLIIEDKLCKILEANNITIND